MSRSVRLGNDARALRFLVSEMPKFRPHIVHNHTVKAGVADAERVATATGMRPEVRHPSAQARGRLESQVDCARFWALFLDARLVSLDQGLNGTIAWFRQTQPALRPGSALAEVTGQEVPAGKEGQEQA